MWHVARSRVSGSGELSRYLESGQTCSLGRATKTPEQALGSGAARACGISRDPGASWLAGEVASQRLRCQASGLVPARVASSVSACQPATAVAVSAATVGDELRTNAGHGDRYQRAIAGAAGE